MVKLQASTIAFISHERKQVGIQFLLIHRINSLVQCNTTNTIIKQYDNKASAFILFIINRNQSKKGEVTLDKIIKIKHCHYEDDQCTNIRQDYLDLACN